MASRTVTNRFLISKCSQAVRTVCCSPVPLSCSSGYYAKNVAESFIVRKEGIKAKIIDGKLLSEKVLYNTLMYFLLDCPLGYVHMPIKTFISFSSRLDCMYDCS